MKKCIIAVLLLLLVAVVGCSAYIAPEEPVDSGVSITPDYMAEISKELAGDTTAAPVADSSVGVTTTVADTSESTTVAVSVTTCKVDVTTVAPAITTTLPSPSTTVKETTTYIPYETTVPVATTIIDTVETTTSTSVTTGGSEVILPTVPFEPETTVVEEADSGTVYWTPGGSVWHTTESCSSLSRSKEIISGTEEQAIQAGKERVCKKCG